MENNAVDQTITPGEV